MKKNIIHTPVFLIVFFLLIAGICFSIYFSNRPIVFKKEIVSPSVGLIRVEKVVDGDTIDVVLDGKKTPVRFIGVNAPEIYQGKNPECFATASAMFVKNAIEQKQVRLMSDPSQDDKDIYGRLLRYIFLEDGTNFNEELVIQGYAKEYTYKIPYQYQQEFKSAQAEAKVEQRGLWGNCSTIMK